MAAPKSKTKKPELSSEEVKALLIQTGRKHFAMHGYNGASLKDIAQEAGITNSLINYHFSDKNGLFQAIIETFAQNRMSTIQRFLTEPKSKDEMRIRLQLFVEEMLTSIMEDPYSFDIVEREVRLGNPAVMELFQSTILVAFSSVVNFFSQAQDQGLLREETDPLVAAGLLFTVTCDPARKDVFAKKFFNHTFGDPEWRSKFAIQVVNLFMQGVMK
jgi:TetR/AcrR family transcriptional regulator